MKEIVIVVLIFVVSTYLGYVWACNNPSLAGEVVKRLFGELSFVKNLPSYAVFLLILTNNAVKSFLSMISGVIFGVVPVFFVMINGFMIGVVSAVFSERVGLLRVVLMLLPHGILEIPAVLIACSYGLKLGIAFLRKIRGRGVDLRAEFKRALNVYVRYVLPMLITAAFIETYVTPIISRV